MGRRLCLLPRYRSHFVRVEIADDDEYGDDDDDDNDEVDGDLKNKTKINPKNTKNVSFATDEECLHL